MRIGQPFAIALIALLRCALLPAAEQPRIDFARDVQPLFKNRCYSCHDGRKHKAGLRLDVRASAASRRRIRPTGHCPRPQQ